MRNKNIVIVVAALSGWAIGLVPTVACARDYDVRDFGAKGDGATKNTEAIQRAIERFRDRKLGLMMHFGLYSQVGIVESWPLSDKDAYWSRRELERDLSGEGFKEWYYDLNRSFNPVRFHPEDWAKAAVEGGFKYVIFTTKHHDGFCLYDTKETDYKTTAASCPFAKNKNADIVRSLFDACCARGLGVTAYFSKVDWHNDDFWEDRGIGRVTDRRPTYDVKADPAKWKRFCDFNRRQILELVRGYGPIDALWLDGGWINRSCGIEHDLPDVIAEARKVQLDLLAIDRHDPDGVCEDIATPEQTVPAKPLARPWESCITMAANWGYHYDDQYKDARTLIHLLVDVVAKGGNLALNVGPMPDGRLPLPALERMKAMGVWLGKNGDAIYATRVRAPYKKGSWAFTQSKDGRRTFAICLWNAGEFECHTALVPKDEALPVPVKIVHLASGREIPFRSAANPALGESGIVLDFPEGFVRDPSADAFEWFSPACMPGARDSMKNR